MLTDVSYALVLGRPLIMWLGLATFTLLLGALSVVLLNTHAKMKIPFQWHVRLATAGMALAIIHAALGLAAYL